jgi:hypothetical protein
MRNAEQDLARKDSQVTNDIIPGTRERVENASDDEINDRIQRETEERVRELSGMGVKDITQRLEELEHEWDVERVLEANAATLSVTGCLLGAAVDRRFFWLPAVVGTFLVQHAVQGWCPPLPILRRMGIRTNKEINYERIALKAVRGDFRDVAGETGSDALADDALAASRKP